MGRFISRFALLTNYAAIQERLKLTRHGVFKNFGRKWQKNYYSKIDYLEDETSYNKKFEIFANEFAII